MIPYFSQKVYNEFAGNEKTKGGDYKNHLKLNRSIFKNKYIRRNELYEDLKNS